RVCATSPPVYAGLDEVCSQDNPDGSEARVAAALLVEVTAERATVRRRREFAGGGQVGCDQGCDRGLRNPEVAVCKDRRREWPTNGRARRAWLVARDNHSAYFCAFPVHVDRWLLAEARHGLVERSGHSGKCQAQEGFGTLVSERQGAMVKPRI